MISETLATDDHLIRLCEEVGEVLSARDVAIANQVVAGASERLDAGATLTIDLSGVRQVTARFVRHALAPALRPTTASTARPIVLCAEDVELLEDLDLMIRSAGTAVVAIGPEGTVLLGHRPAILARLPQIAAMSPCRADEFGREHGISQNRADGMLKDLWCLGLVSREHHLLPHGHEYRYAPTRLATALALHQANS